MVGIEQKQSPSLFDGAISSQPKKEVTCHSIQTCTISAVLVKTLTWVKSELAAWVKVARIYKRESVKTGTARDVRNAPNRSKIKMMMETYATGSGSRGGKSASPFLYFFDFYGVHCFNNLFL